MPWSMSGQELTVVWAHRRAVVEAAPWADETEVAGSTPAPGPGTGEGATGGRVAGVAPPSREFSRRPAWMDDESVLREEARLAKERLLDDYEAIDIENEQRRLG